MEISPLVSIVIPIYNADKYIRRCIESIVAQNFKDYEILLIDDGSIDNSKDICSYYTNCNKQIRYFYQNNKGANRARQLGVQNSCGKYICFVDSDDFLPSNAFDIIYNELLKNEFDIFILGFRKHLIDGRYVERNYCDEYIDTTKYLFNLTKYDIHTSPWAKFYRHALFDEYTFNIPRDINIGEDFIMDTRIVLKHFDEIRIKSITGIFYDYVVRENSVFHSSVATTIYEDRACFRQDHYL